MLKYVRRNHKLGPLIWGFSIPAVKTCPGKTAICEEKCYASHRRYKTQTVKDAQERWLKMTESKCFVKDVIREIRIARIRTFRIHASGDFYNEAYIRKWIEIVKRCSSTVFYAYTRSWRVPELLPALKELAELRNFQMWFSADRDSHAENGPPPEWGRVAWMAVDYGDEVPEYTDVVFRAKRKKVEKFRQGRLICCAENGIPYEYSMTCTDCKICYRKKPVPKRNRDENIGARTDLISIN